jgi:hypothetical protein
MDIQTQRALRPPRKNTAPDPQRALVEQALDTLRQLGVEAQIDRDRPKDRHLDYIATYVAERSVRPFKSKQSAHCDLAR